MKHSKRSGVLLVIVPAAALLASAASPITDRQQVRDRRLAYTAAIQARRPDLMRGYLAPEMVQLSRNGDTQIGRDAVVLTYTQHEFLDSSFIVYDRNPDTVDISENGRFAVERGHWRGRFRRRDRSVTGNSGLYQASWIKRDGTWLIRTESYVRLHCADESDCPR